MAKVYLPSHPLGSASLKVKRANVHYYGLVRSMRSHVAASGPEVIFRPKGEVKGPNVVAGFLVAKPMIYELIIDPRHKDAWGLVIGDVVHNLRSSLEHVAWALALEHARQTGSPLTPDDEGQVHFPLRSDRIAPPNARVGGLDWNDVRFFPPATWDVIEQFQPYNRANRPELEFLAVLHSLWNKDKHRIVTPVFTDIEVSLKPGQSLVGVRLNQPDKSMYLVGRDGALQFGSDFHPEATYEVEVATGLVNPKFMRLWGFRVMYQLIREEVIPAFAGFFPQH